MRIAVAAPAPKRSVAEVQVACLLGLAVSLVQSASWLFSQPVGLDRTSSQRSREQSGRQVEGQARVSSNEYVRQAELDTPTHFNKQLTASITDAGRQRRWSEVEAALKVVRKNGPNTVIFNAAMGAAKKCGLYEEGLALFKEMCTLGLPKSPVTYNTAIGILGKLGRYSEAKSLWIELKQSGLLVDPSGRGHEIAYQAIIGAAAQVGHVEDAKLLFDEVMSKGVPQHLDLFFGAALNACKNARDAPTASAFLDEMERFNCKPNIEHYTCAMGAYRGQALTDIFALEEEMLAHGLRPTKSFVDEHVYSILGAVLSTTQFQELRAAVGRMSADHMQAAAKVIMRAKQRGLPQTMFVSRVDKVLREVGVRIRTGAEAGVQTLGFKASPKFPIVIKSVDPGSWADKEGLADGDLVLEINGKDVNALSMEELKLEMQVRPLQLTFLRH